MVQTVELFRYPADLVIHFVSERERGDERQTYDALRRYEEYCQRHFDSLRPWIAASTSSVLDIGAGKAGVDILIARHLGRPLTINLLDGDGTGARQMSFRATTQAWADRNIGVMMLEANIPASDDMRVLAHAPDPAATIPADLIISLKSWGHHYPVEIYCDLARRSLRGGGVLILDIRRKHIEAGRHRLSEAGFVFVGQAYETEKSRRLVFMKP